jgi:methionyl aminopeptidase
VAVEPMLAIGTSRTVSEGGGWPVMSADRSMTAHYEHDVLVTESGPRVLTAGLDDLPDVVG